MNAIREIISIHAPTRGATLSFYGKTHTKEFQSTLPREERPETRQHFAAACISIHAPTRGATKGGQWASQLGEFQSTLPREERLPPLIKGFITHHFNPRSHERSDWQLCDSSYTLEISIHAPTRGATN